MKNFIIYYEELQNLDLEELQDKIWNDYLEEFGGAIMEDKFMTFQTWSIVKE